MPLAVGFSIKTAERVKQTGQYSDAVVVGYAIINIVRECAENQVVKEETVEKVSAFVSELASGCATRS